MRKNKYKRGKNEKRNNISLDIYCSFNCDDVYIFAYANMEMKIMKALSIREPWASMILFGEKTIETRSWWTHYGGDLLICVTKHQFIHYQV